MAPFFTNAIKSNIVIKGFFFLLFSLLFFSNTNAQTTYYSTASGNWASNIWSTTPGGPSCNCYPTDNANVNVVISSNHIVTFSSNNFNINGNLTVKSNATLDLTKTLELGSGTGCGYTFILENLGKILATGNGNGEKLRICGKTILSANSGAGEFQIPYSGPASFDENGCSSAQPGNFTTSTSSVCAGQANVTYTVPAVSGASGYTFTYSGSGATISGTGNTRQISFSSTATSGTLSVSATFACGSSSARTLPIVVNPPVGTPSAIGGVLTRCVGAGSNAFTTSASNATSYLWTVSGSGNSISGTGTMGTVTWSPTFTGNATITVRAIGCGTSTVVSKTVTVYPIPTVTVPSNYSICNGTTISPGLSSNVSGSSFTWTSSNASVSVPSSGETWRVENLTNATATSTITVTATTPNGCTGTNSFQITVSPTNEWNGSSDDNWHNANNWCGGIPTSNQNVVIPSSAPNFPVVSANATCRNLTINTPGSLTIEGATLTVEGTSQIDGSLIFDNAASTIVYNGPSIYNGSWTDNAAGTVVYNNNVVFNKALTSRSSITVNGNLTFPTSGNIKMTDNASLTLGLAATYTGASKSSFVEGKMRKVLASTSMFVFPVGQDTLYRRVGITPQTATQTIYDATYVTGNSNTISKNKVDNTSDPLFLYQVSEVEYWLLEKDVLSAKAKVTLFWGTSSVVSPNGDYYNELRVAHYNQGIDSWEGFPIETVASSASMNSGSITSLDYLSSFSPFTLGAITTKNTLPVQLKSFNLTQATSGVQLDWETASETINAGFEIERSYDGFKTFETLGFVAGNGTTSETNLYSFLDPKASGKMVYYRLKQIDFDEKITYSEIKYLLMSRPAASTLIYPNPTTGIVVVTIGGIEAEKQITYSIVGADGIARVLNQKAAGEALNNHLSADLSSLMNGAYTIMITTAKTRHSIKVIKI